MEIKNTYVQVHVHVIETVSIHVIDNYVDTTVLTPEFKTGGGLTCSDKLQSLSGPLLLLTQSMRTIKPHQSSIPLYYIESTQCL